MFWLALRFALGVALLTRRHPGRATKLAGVALLPPVMRPLAWAAIVIRFALDSARFMRRF